MNPLYAPPWYSFPATVPLSYRNPMCPETTVQKSQPSFAHIEYRGPGGTKHSVALADEIAHRVMESIGLGNGDFPCSVK